MKILVGIVAHQLRSETLRRVHSFDWDDDGYDVLTLWGRDMRAGENRFQAVTRKYQMLERRFLAGPYDALLTIEQDMLPPPDAMTRLAKLCADGADIAYGLYVWRYQEQPWWNAHPKIKEDDAGVPWFWSMTQYPGEAKRLWGQPTIVAGLGLGCTMITRPTMARLGFRQGRLDHCCDTTLALDACKENLIQVCDFGAVCGHYLDDTSVIWPDPESDTLYTIKEAT